jgi:hypothetical protein
VQPNSRIGDALPGPVHRLAALSHPIRASRTALGS